KPRDFRRGGLLARARAGQVHQALFGAVEVQEPQAFLDEAVRGERQLGRQVVNQQELQGDGAAQLRASARGLEAQLWPVDERAREGRAVLATVRSLGELLARRGHAEHEAREVVVQRVAPRVL